MSTDPRSRDAEGNDRGEPLEGDGAEHRTPHEPEPAGVDLEAALESSAWLEGREGDAAIDRGIADAERRSMTLGRVWIPSPNYSASRARNRLLVIHTSEGATTFRSLGNYLSSASVAVSYAVAFDNTTATEIGEFVKPEHKSWSAHSANNEGEHGCLCTPNGASGGWSRADWLARPLMLDACAQWLREESARYGVPLVKISGAEIAAGAAGVCGHRDCVDAGLGGNHSDPGPNFPYDAVLGSASSEDDMTPQEHALLVDVHEYISARKLESRKATDPPHVASDRLIVDIHERG